MKVNTDLCVESRNAWYSSSIKTPDRGSRKPEAFLDKGFSHKLPDLLYPVVAMCWEVLLLQICKTCGCLFLLVGGQPEGDPISQCCVAQPLQQGTVSEMGNPKQSREGPFCPAGSAHH